VEIHTSIEKASEEMFQELRRRFYTTPKSYLDLINLYVQLLAEKRNERETARDRLLNGLNKLQDTNSVVDTMKIELAELQPVLKEKEAKTRSLVVQVRQDEEAALKVKERVEADHKVVQQQAAETMVIKEDAERDLNEAMPALQAAVDALDSLDKNDITEMKSFAKPPPLVQTTMEAVCVLMGEKADWDTSKRLLGDAQFIKRLKEYDKDNIPEKALKQLKKYIDDPNYTPERVQSQSKAARSICMWTRAMDVYAVVAKVVEPKKQALAAAESMLEEAQASLQRKMDDLKEVEDKVAELQRNLKVAEEDQRDLQAQADLAAKRLNRAGKLTSALGDEAVRWKATAKEIGDSMPLLVGDVFLSAAAISYIGAFTGQYRDRITSSWVERCKEQNIPVSDNFSLRTTLSNPVEVREWNINGLPTDSVSVDNAVLVTRGRRWPLMVDPQSQANKWVKAMEQKNGLRIIRLTDANYLRTLENSIRIGNPVLMEDVQEMLDPALEPVLQKQTFSQGGRTLIRLGDSDVDYDPNFKFYITTKMPNPHYLPEVCIKVTLINFTVTMQGLEDQLLGDVVRKERPDLEEQKNRLVLSISTDKKQLKDLEDKILKLLKDSKGNILDDEVLINTLNTSKLTSGHIEKRVQEAEVAEHEINAARELYRTVPKRGSILYFVIADLAMIDPMYQYSLSYFVQLFNLCIDASEKADELADRLQILMDYTTDFMYQTVCRGLFEAHKGIFSFLICTAIQRAAGDIATPDWNFLLRGGIPPATMPKNPDPEALTGPQWEQLVCLSDVGSAWEGLSGTVAKTLPEWTIWAESEEPHRAALPGEWEEKLSALQKLLLVRVLREEKLVSAFSAYVGDHLGPRFTEAPPFNLTQVYADTTKSTPVIFILSTGADPTGMLQRFAEGMDRVPGERLHIISLGQGQGPIAERIIKSAQQSGDWVCLQNCHLASSWMLELERIVEAMQGERASEVHDEFRLWLTSMPTKIFPVPVLQNGIKLTNEPPKGVKANLARSYADITPAFLESCAKPAPWKKLVFACAYFHAVLQERRKFGPLGWNIRYDFSNSDLECSLQTLRNFLDEQPDIPWAALEYVTGQINYGGRVTDDNDRRLLMSILRRYYVPSILDDSYAFTPSGTYRAPPEGDHASYVSYIKSLPAMEAPEVFGMHANANISFQLQETRKVVDTVLSMQPRATGGGGGEGKSGDELVDELAQEILAGLPGKLDREEAHESTFALAAGGLVNSLGTVLGQEMDRFNRLLSKVGSSLRELRRALQGLVVMSGDLELMYDKMLSNRVPDNWAKVAYPSLKPLAGWVKDFRARMEFMRGWLTKGEPAVFWLPGFFFPQGFMTGALQVYARKYQFAIDTLQFGFNVLEAEDAEGVEEPPTDGMYISGLYLEAARWDRGSRVLAEAAPGVMHTPLPVVHFQPKVDYTPPSGEYQCPLYKTSVRAGVLSTTGQSTNFVLMLSLPLPVAGRQAEENHWTLQGVAALCALDE